MPAYADVSCHEGMDTLAAPAAASMTGLSELAVERIQHRRRLVNYARSLFRPPLPLLGEEQ